MIELDLYGYALIFLALALGGMLKGATGMGTPVIAVPVMASFFDVRLAVALMVLPNLCTNSWQLWKYRAHFPKDGLAYRFALGGGLGAALGTILLAKVSPDILINLVAAAVLLYIGLRLTKPDFKLGPEIALKTSFPISTISGVLQGAAGISAPVSVSFLNACRLDRLVFIPTISLFFATMSITQFPTLLWYDLLTLELVLLGGLALIPMFGAMPIGAWLARSISPTTFDRLTLVVLFLLAVKLILDPWWLEIF